MECYLAISLVMLCQVSAIKAQTAMNQSEDEKQAAREVAVVDNDFNEALGHNDADALDRIIADECIFTNDIGKTFGKEHRLKVTTSSKVVFTSYSADDVRIRIYGDTAVVTERNTTTSKARDPSHTGSFRYTRVYVKRDGRWQLVAAQKSPTVSR